MSELPWRKWSGDWGRHPLILAACRTAIDSAGAPLCYVHGQPDGGPAYVIVTHEAFERLTAGSTATEAEWLNHGHVEPDDDLPYDG
jgi:hypothetical protein